MNIHMDIHIWVPRDPWGGSMDTLGGPMGPWDRWDLGTDGTWASRTPDTSSEDTSSKDTSSISRCRMPSYPGPVPDPRLPGPGAGYPAAGPGAGCRLPGRPFFDFFRFFSWPGPVQGVPRSKKKTFFSVLCFFIFL